MQTVQALAELPTNLLESVIAASPIHLSHHLANLPEAFHATALNAVCPNVASEGKFTLPDSHSFGTSLSESFWDRLWPLVAQHTHLQHLEVTNAGPQAVKSLLPYLDCLPSLRHVSFDSNGLRDDDVKGLWEHMNEVTTLEYLNLSQNELNALHCKPLGFLIERAIFLTELVLSQNNTDYLAKDGFSIVQRKLGHAFEASLCNLASLKRLNLRDCSLAVTGIARQLEFLPSLESLDLSQNLVNALDVEMLASQLCYVTLLTSLNLSGMGIRKPAILAYHVSCLVKLEKLDLADNEVCSDGLAVFDANSVSSLTALRELFLERNSIDGAGFSALARTVEYLPSLRRLALTGNIVGLGDMGQWHTSLSNFQSLRSLNLCQNRIGSNASHLLCSQLQWFSGLKRLFLRLNSFGPSEFVASAPHFISLTLLEHLSMSGNRVGDAGMKALVPRLHCFCRLTYLGLSDIGLTDSGAIALSHSLHCRQPLEELHIGNRRVGHKGVAALVKCFKELPDFRRVYFGDDCDAEASVSDYIAAGRGLTSVEIFAHDAEQTPKQFRRRCELHPYQIDLEGPTR